MNIYLPKWLRARIPQTTPPGFLSVLVQELVIELFPKPSLVTHWNAATENAAAALILAKAKAMRASLQEPKQ